VAPAVGGIAGPFVETAINDAITALVAPGLASIGFRRTPSSVVSARRVTIAASGIALALVIADLFGPAVTAIPGNLNATVAPAPQAGTQRVYTVTVTNAATGAPVDQADVTLHNFTTTGTAVTVGPLKTSVSGQVTFNVALRPKISYKVIPVDHERVRIFASPTLTVSKAGFNAVNLTLLEDDGGI
jgi:hypothetical protein